MTNRYNDRLAEIEAKRKRKNLIYKVLACAGCLVIGVTAFAMMTPAITMEQQDDPAASAAISAASAEAEQAGAPAVIDNSDSGNLENGDTEQTQDTQAIESGEGTMSDNSGGPEGIDDVQNTEPSGGQQEAGVIVSESEPDLDQNTDPAGNQDDENDDVQALTEEPDGDQEICTLSISNTIDNSETTGEEPSETQEFTFTVKLKNGTEPMAGAAFPYTKGDENGMLIFDEDGKSVITLKHNESVVLELPYGITWHVIAEPCAGYLTEHRIDSGDVTDGANTGEQTLTAPAAVVYINSEASYTLPETGGPGTALFILAGCLMFIGAGALLMRRRTEYEA